MAATIKQQCSEQKISLTYIYAMLYHWRGYDCRSPFLSDQVTYYIVSQTVISPMLTYCMFSFLCCHSVFREAARCLFSVRIQFKVLKTLCIHNTNDLHSSNLFITELI